MVPSGCATPASHCYTTITSVPPDLVSNSWIIIESWAVGVGELNYILSLFLRYN